MHVVPLGGDGSEGQLEGEESLFTGRAGRSAQGIIVSHTPRAQEGLPGYICLYPLDVACMVFCWPA